MRNRKNYEESEPLINTDEVITIPDETFSIREILVRFSTGQNIDSMKRAIVYSNPDDDDWSMPYMATLNHDLTDLDNARIRTKDLEEDARKKYAEYVKNKKMIITHSKEEIKDEKVSENI